MTPHGRLLLVQRVVVHDRPIAHAARELGVSRQCAHRWVTRYRAEGEAGLVDRSSRPLRTPSRTPARVEARVLRVPARSRQGRDRVASATGVPARTVSRILARHAVPALTVCDPVTGLPIRATRATSCRYERDAPGRPGACRRQEARPDPRRWRLARARPWIKRTAARDLGFDYVHAAVADHSRLAYAEILPDEKGATCAACLLRAAAWFAGHGIVVREVITDNAKNYILSRDFAAALAAIGAKHRRIKPHCPWQNGKVERFNRTMATEWAYRRPFVSNTARTRALAPWLRFYNTERAHHALGGHPPISRAMS
nr:IS481 family transposase [Kineosporia sp. A_224]